MAKTIEEHIQQTLGSLVWQIVKLQTENEALREEKEKSGDTPQN